MSFFKVIIALGFALLWNINSVVADSLPDGFSLPTQFDLFDGMATEEIAQANAGDCAPLLKAVGPENEDWGYSTKANFYGEMYDRGLCVEKDPGKAFRLFESAIRSSQQAAHAVLGWKYTYGHGVEQSDEKAREAFKDFFNYRVLHMFFRPILEDGHDGLRGRPQPPEFKLLKTWYYETLATKEQKITYLREILRGTATYFDGSPVTKEHQYVGQVLLYSVAGLAAGNYFYGIERLALAKTPEEEAAATTDINYAAASCYLPAILKMAELSDPKFGAEDTESNQNYALALYMHAKSLGADVDDDINRLRNVFSISQYFSLDRALKSTQPYDC